MLEFGWSMLKGWAVSVIEFAAVWTLVFLVSIATGNKMVGIAVNLTAAVVTVPALPIA